MYAYVVNLSVCSIHLCKAQTSSRIHAEAGGFCVGLWANCRSLPTGDCFVGKSRDGPWDAGRENRAPPKSHGIFPWFFPLVWPFRKSISLLQTRHDTFPTSSTFCRLRHEIAQVTVGRTLSWLIRFCGRSRSSTTAAWRRLWGLPRVLAMMALPRSKWWKWLSIHIVTTSKFNEAIDAFFLGYFDESRIDICDGWICAAKNHQATLQKTVQMMVIEPVSSSRSSRRYGHPTP